MKKEYKIGIVVAIILVGISSFFLISSGDNNGGDNRKDYYFKGHPYATEIPCDSGREIRQNLSNKRHYVVSKDFDIIYKNLSNKQLLSYIESKEISCYLNKTSISTCVSNGKVVCQNSDICKSVFIRCNPKFSKGNI